MPVFAPSISKTLRATLDVSPVGTPFNIYTWLSTGPDAPPVAEKRQLNLISSGANQVLDFAYIMPASAGVYKVNILIEVIGGGSFSWIGDASSDVIIPGVSLSTISWV